MLQATTGRRPIGIEDRRCTSQVGVLLRRDTKGAPDHSVAAAAGARTSDSLFRAALSPLSSSTPLRLDTSSYLIPVARPIASFSSFHLCPVPPPPQPPPRDVCRRTSPHHAQCLCERPPKLLGRDRDAAKYARQTNTNPRLAGKRCRVVEEECRCHSGQWHAGETGRGEREKWTNVAAPVYTEGAQ